MRKWKTFFEMDFEKRYQESNLSLEEKEVWLERFETRLEIWLIYIRYNITYSNKNEQMLWEWFNVAHNNFNSLKECEFIQRFVGTFIELYSKWTVRTYIKEKKKYVTSPEDYESFVEWYHYCADLVRDFRELIEKEKENNGNA